MTEASASGEYLAIADISGYTSYLAGVELDHAHDILADLMVTTVGAMGPFVLAKLEGDAAFMAAPSDAFDGSLLQDTVEGTYVAFQRRLRDIKQASTCECDACVRIPDLDLKIVVHHGQVQRHSLMGLEELVGPDVILVHRLLKNEIRERMGIAAYALYTQAALDAAGVDPAAQGLRAHTEDTDVAGTVELWLRDLARVWHDLAASERLVIPPERRAGLWDIEFDAPPSVVFEHMTSPRMRLAWNVTTDSIDEDSSLNGGRRGIGTTNHCMHGENAIVERILDWRPPDYWLVETEMPMPGSPRFLKSEEYIALPDGRTALQFIIGSVEGEMPEDHPEVFALMASGVDGATESIRAKLADSLAEVAVRTTDAPPLPSTEARHLTAPIRLA